VFLPSQSTTLLALEVSQWLPLDVIARRSLQPRKGALATEQQGKDANADWPEEELRLARMVLGEQFVGLLAMVTRRRAYREAGTKFQLVDPQGHFDLEFGTSLVQHLQLLPSHPHFIQFLQELAKDFRQWVAAGPAELGTLGLVDEGSSGILMNCNALSAVLPPLAD
jgi:hypothetical protein